MIERSSQKTRARDPRAPGQRRLQALLSLVAGLVLLTAFFTVVAWFTHSELGRTFDAHLTQLANPESWVRCAIARCL